MDIHCLPWDSEKELESLLSHTFSVPDRQPAEQASWHLAFHLSPPWLMRAQERALGPGWGGGTPEAASVTPTCQNGWRISRSQQRACCDLSMSPLQPLSYPSPSDGMRTWGLRGALRSPGGAQEGVSAAAAPLPLAPPAPSVGTEPEARSLQPARGLTRTRPCGRPDSGHPASRNETDKFLLFPSHPVCAILS